MKTDTMAASSPLAGINTSFASYLDARKNKESAHMQGNGVPDYAYGSDYELRKKLDSIPQLYNIAKKITVTEVSKQMQLMNQNAVCATPTNFPDVYESGCECARRLGIAIPNIYIRGGTEINAYTYACDDIEPFIVIYSALYERLSPGELKACIGHECGHIQNYHGTYKTIATLIASGGSSALGGISKALAKYLTQGVVLALYSWSRAGEVTADRAGLICAEDVEDCYSLNAKLMYGAAFGEHQVDYNALKEQLIMEMNNFSKYSEIWYTHPTAVRRIMAVKEFSECRTYYEWRPDLKRPDSILRSMGECDERCKKFINLSSKGQKGV